MLLCIVFLYVLLFILSAMPPCLLCTSTRLELLGSKTIDTIVLFIICYILIFVISFSFVAQWIFMFSISFESESGARGYLAHFMNLTIECQFLMRKISIHFKIINGQRRFFSSAPQWPGFLNNYGFYRHLSLQLECNLWKRYMNPCIECATIFFHLNLIQVILKWCNK